MIEINLVPDVKQQLIAARQIRSTVISGAIIVIIVALGIIALLAAYVFAVQSIRFAIADDAIAKGGTKLAAVEDLSKMLTIQNQLTKIDALNDNKKINSRMFEVLSAIIPPSPNDVQISNVNIDAETGTIALEGQASSGYAALETFKKTISVAFLRYKDADDKQQEVRLASDISTSNISYGDDATGKKVLRFNISYKYAEELFSPNVSTTSIVLVSGGNVTDSYLGIPKSIFAERAQDLETTQ